MVKMRNFKLCDGKLFLDVLIEGKENQKYSLVLDYSSEKLEIISSNIPGELRVYEYQARVALKEYYGKALPETVMGMWC